jgi:hypothetical protein
MGGRKEKKRKAKEKGEGKEEQGRVSASCGANGSSSSALVKKTLGGGEWQKASGPDVWRLNEA